MFYKKSTFSERSWKSMENPGKWPDFGQICRSKYVSTLCGEYVNSGHICPGFQSCPRNIVLKYFDCPGF